MAEVRLRIQKDLEKSSAPGAVFITDANSEGAFLPAGSNTMVLTMVGGFPTWQAAASGGGFTLSDGTNNQVVNAGETLFAAAGNGLSVVVGATDKFTYTLKVSTDANNAAVFGVDGGLYVPVAKVVTGASWNDSTNTLTITFSDSSVVNVPILDVVGAFLADFRISDGTANDLINNHETITFTGTNRIKTAVTANTVTVSIDTAGSTNGQVLTSTGPSTPPVWASTAASVPTPRTDEFSPASGATTVALSATPSVTTGYTRIDIYRNGRLLQASNYSIAGTTVTFTQAFGASTGAIYSETITAKYYV